MIFSPMSEIPQIGRNPVYVVTLIIFVVFQVPTALATNFGMLMAVSNTAITLSRVNLTFT